MIATSGWRFGRWRGQPRATGQLLINPLQRYLSYIIYVALSEPAHVSAAAQQRQNEDLSLTIGPGVGAWAPPGSRRMWSPYKPILLLLHPDFMFLRLPCPASRLRRVRSLPSSCAQQLFIPTAEQKGEPARACAGAWVSDAAPAPPPLRTAPLTTGLPQCNGLQSSAEPRATCWRWPATTLHTRHDDKNKRHGAGLPLPDRARGAVRWLMVPSAIALPSSPAL